MPIFIWVGATIVASILGAVAMKGVDYAQTKYNEPPKEPPTPQPVISNTAAEGRDYIPLYIAIGLVMIYVITKPK